MNLADFVMPFETEVIDTAGSKSAQIAASFDASADEADAGWEDAFRRSGGSHLSQLAVC
ncbi:hypothetical protein [Adhaeretor mobilis]|uniref:Uncharacterized protein n=1 Tax=Adhaeretor mobilis TaxID=1930276 RepID=A0A517MVW6_9BACT|nr:hypothetical protein [Adhaeretor mobilis]QDS99025.1 hypothetical protein HG15A2_23140 [Adhaeretor mobilis]